MFAKMPWSSLALVAMAGILTICTFATIRPLDLKTGKAIIGNDDQKLNAANVAGDLWDSKVLSALEEGATASEPQWRIRWFRRWPISPAAAKTQPC